VRFGSFKNAKISTFDYQRIKHFSGRKPHSFAAHPTDSVHVVICTTIAMNGFNGPAPVWQEYRSPDGRVYYYNSATKATQWTKPEEMMTAAEV